jgi:U2 small nuclear ribonucleoprotein B''
MDMETSENKDQPQLASSEVPPNHTIYVKNLNEKVKLDELKKSLYHVFGQFGNILEINASKTLKMRGQAWIVFDDLGGSTKALRDMQGFTFYGKQMKVSYAKSKSDCVAKIDGSFVPRPKRKLDAPDGKKKKKEKGTEGKKEGKEKGSKEPKEKKRKVEKSSESKADGQRFSGSSQDSHNTPNKILFVENLPPQCNQMMLGMLFDKYPGYKEARMVPDKPGIAFVEFADAFQAQAARDGLQNFKITPTILMKISFAKQ